MQRTKTAPLFHPMTPAPRAAVPVVSSLSSSQSSPALVAVLDSVDRTGQVGRRPRAATTSWSQAVLAGMALCALASAGMAWRLSRTASARVPSSAAVALPPAAAALPQNAPTLDDSTAVASTPVVRAAATPPVVDAPTAKGVVSAPPARPVTAPAPHAARAPAVEAKSDTRGSQDKTDVAAKVEKAPLVSPPRSAGTVDAVLQQQLQNVIP